MTTGEIAGLLDSLPPLHRLALAYARARVWRPTFALLALDQRLAGIVRSASEPMLAQIRLSWWREMLARDASGRPSGEPLLAALESWGHRAAGLTALVDGWESLIGEEPVGRGSLPGFCEGRGRAFALLAGVADRAGAAEAARHAGRGWALADLACRLGAPAEREAALDLVRTHEWARIALPRELRPLAMLHGVAARAGKAGRGIGAPSPGMFATALRIGLFGR